MAQWVNDPVLSLLRFGSLQWRGFDPGPGNFCMLQAQPKKSLCIMEKDSKSQRFRVSIVTV